MNNGIDGETGDGDGEEEDNKTNPRVMFGYGVQCTKSTS